MCVPIRGNVETRLRKLLDGEYDAIVLALAGLTRLELTARFQVLDAELMPPAPGQGALAIQARAGDRDVHDLVEPLHDPATAAPCAPNGDSWPSSKAAAACPLAHWARRTPTDDSICWARSLGLTVDSQ